MVILLAKTLPLHSNGWILPIPSTTGSPQRQEVSTLSMDFCPLQRVSPLLPPAAHSWWRPVVRAHSWLWYVMRCDFLPFARYQDTVHTLQFQIWKGGGTFSQESMASALDLGFNWAETSISKGFSLVYVGPQCCPSLVLHSLIRSTHSPFTWKQPLSRYRHLPGKVTSLPSPSMERDRRQSHSWGGASSLLVQSCSVFRPLVCREGCSSIMWCGITIAELFHHLQ